VTLAGVTPHRGVDPDHLTGEAARQFDTFRRLHRTFGSSPEQATRFAINDLLESGLVELSQFDQQVDHYRSQGMSESAARTAATGRAGSEHEARTFWDGPSASGTSLMEADGKPTGPAAMVAFYRLMGEVQAWREAAKLAETDDLRARANGRADAAFEKALKHVPDRVLDEVWASVKQAESQAGGKPGRQVVEAGGQRRVKLTEPGGRRP